jgi:hypothetical protein
MPRFLAAIFLALLFGSTSGAATFSVRPGSAIRSLRQSLDYEENVGHLDPAARFVARMKNSSLLLTDDGWILAPRSAKSLRARFLAPRKTIWKGESLLPSRVNVYRGADPSRWKTGIPTYEAARAREVWPGIDVVYRARGQAPEYDFIVRPGAKLASVRVTYEGAKKIRASGSRLVIDLSDGSRLVERLMAYEYVGGRQLPARARYVVSRRGEVSIRSTRRSPTSTLVIDPVLEYSTYLGGLGNEIAFRVAADSAGNSYVTGMTQPSDFPGVRQPPGPCPCGWDVFVTKYDIAGSVVYSTFIGGELDDEGRDIAVDPSGNAYLTGSTRGNYPGIGTPTTFREYAFLTKLDGNGVILWSKAIGGSTSEIGYGVAADSSGAYVVGSTLSSDFPVKDAFQETYPGNQSGFIIKVDPSGGLVFSSFIGGDGATVATDVAVDQFSYVYICGVTGASNLLLISPVQNEPGSSLQDTFVMKLTPGGAVHFSSLLGGSSDLEWAQSVGSDTWGNLYVGGWTYSTDFPVTAESLKSHNAGDRDGFISKFASEGSRLVYSTYVGGSDTDDIKGIVVDSTADVYFGGETYSSDFPFTSPLQPRRGANDALVGKLSASGTALLFASPLGGSSTEVVYGVAAADAHDFFAVGATTSTDFPTLNPAQMTLGGADDAFVVRIDTTPEPAKFYTLEPCRLIDTRAVDAPSFGANTTRLFSVSGKCGIPADAVAVALALTAVNSTDTGDFRIYPANSSPPLASALNFPGNKVRSGNAVIGIGPAPIAPANGVFVLCDMPVSSNGTVDLVVDVYGFFR